ncbi:unnamed protein product, partial [marine sediment metagenome]
DDDNDRGGGVRVGYSEYCKVIHYKKAQALPGPQSEYGGTINHP